MAKSKGKGIARNIFQGTCAGLLIIGVSNLFMHTARIERLEERIESLKDDIVGLKKDQVDATNITNIANVLRDEQDLQRARVENLMECSTESRVGLQELQLRLTGFEKVRERLAVLEAVKAERAIQILSRNPMGGDTQMK